MPRTFLRLIAVALLALAVPLQGMAAVIAAECMAFGHHQNAAGEDAAAVHYADEHAHDGAGGHDHATHSHADTGKSKPAGEGGKKSHCGPCTACCASASIAGPVGGLVLLAAASEAVYAFSQVPPPAFEPDGLDRPPLAL